MTGNEEFTGPIINRDFVTGPSSSTRAESSFEGCVGTKVPFFPSPFWRKKVVRVVFLLPDPEHLSIFLHAIYTDSDSSSKHRISCKISQFSLKIVRPEETSLKLYYVMLLEKIFQLVTNYLLQEWPAVWVKLGWARITDLQQLTVRYRRPAWPRPRPRLHNNPRRQCRLA